MDGLANGNGLSDAGRTFGFGRAGVLRCERAVAELRAGRPVLVSRANRSVAVLALDSAAPETFETMARLAGPSLRLYLTAQRAKVIGLSAPGGALIPLEGKSYEDACSIGYAQDVETPLGSESADAFHGEAAELARLALLLPALVVADVDASGDEFADCPEIVLGDVEEGWRTAGRRFEIVSRSPVPLKGVGRSEFVVFRGGFAQRDQVAIIVGEPDLSLPVPVRVHSSCLTGDLFGSLKCDCGDQLRNAVRALDERGGGILLYLDQEGRGTGIASKMRAYSLQCEGLDTVDADATLGYVPDGRRYETAAAMLQKLGVAKVELLTNNPRKIAQLRAGGIDVVGRTPLYGDVTAENRNYLRTKADRSGHLIDVDGLAGGA